MAILINRHTRLLVQGMTGPEGLFHTQQMIAYGTNVVGGVTPSKGGEWLEGKPIFDTIKEGRESTGANVVIGFVPPYAAAEAIFEAIDAEMELIVCITEFIPIREMLRVRQYLKHSTCRLLGPNSPGVLTPGQAKVGIIPGDIATTGSVGVVSRSSSLTYEIVNTLTERGIGQSTCVGIGADPIGGMSFVDVLQMFEDDPHTDRIVLIGEIGGDAEQNAARFIRDHMTKPVIAFIAGKTAPEGRAMGHAGALIEGSVGTYRNKVDALRTHNVKIADRLEQIPDLL